MESKISMAMTTTTEIIPPMSHQLMTVGGGRVDLTVKVPDWPSMVTV
jgi:hypothetical protein